MFRSGAGAFDRCLEKATSQLLLEPDWASILSLTDLIRGGEVPPKYAVSAIKKRFYHENPHVAYYALQVMESCVKNCGSLIHEEVATKQFMEELRELVKQTNDENIKKKVLEMIQNWGMAFRNSPKYRIVTDTLNLMKAEGWEFPPVREAEAMFEADVAPEWAEGEVCHRCRTQFGLMTRQHHCRACGQVFCSKCSAKACVLPKFGIEKEVRVCDSCFDEFGPKDNQSSSEPNSPQKAAGGGSGRQQRHASESNSDLPAEYLKSSLAQQAQTPPTKSEEEIKEEEELQLALALSQSEAEEKEKSKQRGQLHQHQPQQPRQEAPKNNATTEEEISPELMRYLNRDYWEQREKGKGKKTVKPATVAAKQERSVAIQEPHSITATSVSRTMATMSKVDGMMPREQAKASLVPMGKNDEELDEFVTTLKTQVEIFVNRMKSNSSRGRSIANDSSVQTLFMNTMAMHSQLLKNIQEQEDKRVYYEGLQDKLTQVKDARAALEALREEERERKRREAEEAERQRQIQMQEKLEVMRKKKQEYLQYQRQLALQRMQEQERELMLRQEQVKQQYMMQQALPVGMSPLSGGIQGPMYQQQHPGAPAMSPAGMPYMSLPPQGMVGYGAPPGQQPIYTDPSSMGLPSYQSAVMSSPGQPVASLQGLPVTQMGPSAPGSDMSSLHQQHAMYNMHSMANALPQQQQNQYVATQPVPHGGQQLPNPQTGGDQLISFD